MNHANFPVPSQVSSRIRRYYFRDELYTNPSAAVGIGRRGSVGSRNCGRWRAVWWDLPLAGLLMHVVCSFRTFIAQ